MTVELFAEDKPVTVENFIRYVKAARIATCIHR
jgi:cyclophilin family peptidyl-prolyl cis-trans isomerase